MSLFGSTKEEFETLLATPHERAPLPSQEECEAIHRSTMETLTIAAHVRQQDARAEALRCDLAAILGERLRAEMERDINPARLSASSRKQYKEDITRFRLWCGEVGVSFLPATPATVATFILDVCGGDDGPKPAMAARLCTAIRLAHQVTEMPDPVAGPYVRAVRRWLKQSFPQLSEPAAPDGVADSKH